MWSKLTRAALVGCLTTACCFLCHCAKIPEILKPEDEARRIEAEMRFQSILAVNSELETIKGIGRVRLQQNNHIETFKAAWNGRQPNQLRLEVLAITGQPMMSIAFDGQYHYFLSYSDNRLIRKKASGNGLKRFIGIDLTPGDLLNFLCGRLPVDSNGTPFIEDDVDSAYLIVADRHGTIKDRIFRDTDNGVWEMERRDRRGKLLFRIVFSKTRLEDVCDMPQTVTISNDDTMAQLTIDKCWMNPGISEDRFTLTLKEEAP